MKREILGVFLIVLLLGCLSLSGCIFNQAIDEGMDLSPGYEEGDTWKVRVENDEYEKYNKTVEVVNTSEEWNDQEVYNLSYEIVMDDYEKDGVQVTDMSGKGRGYKQEDGYGGLLYERWKLTGNVSDYGLSGDYTYIQERNSTYEGELPEHIQVGDSWKMNVSRHTEVTVKWMGTTTSEREETKHFTRNFTVVDKKEVNVSAGTFECLQVNWTTLDADQSGVFYYSEEAKTKVKSTTELEEISYGKIKRTTELLSCDFQNE